MVEISSQKVIQLTDSLLNCGESPILLIHIFLRFLFVYFMMLLLMIFGRQFSSYLRQFITFLTACDANLSLEVGDIFLEMSPTFERVWHDNRT